MPVTPYSRARSTQMVFDFLIEQILQREITVAVPSEDDACIHSISVKARLHFRQLSTLSEKAFTSIFIASSHVF